MAIMATGLATAIGASFTDPFTLGADIVTAIPVFVGALLLAGRLRSGGGAAVELRSEHAAARLAPLNRWALVWLGLFVAVLGWELYTYLSAPRHAHPTLSALIDMLDATPTGKFVAFSLWLALGWYLVLQ
jgi:hypothetical protein